MKKLTKSKKFWQSVCGCGFVFSLGIIALSTCLLLKKDKDSFSNVEGDGSYVTIGELSTTDEDGNVTGFDKDKMQLLLDMISNEESVNFEKIDQLAGYKQTSADFRLNTINKEGNQDIVVTLGGLEWTAVYLSQTKEKEDGTCDTILTLWLSNSTQKAWQDENGANRSDLKSNQGKCYGFFNGGLYSRWSATSNVDKTSEGTAEFYPCDMYGTSYIRVVTLNNGGQYAKDNTTLSIEYQKNENSVFAKFTMEDVTGSLTDYIVKPEQVEWQEYQSGYDSTPGLNGQNDAWSPDMPDRGFTSPAYNYAEHDHNEDWKDDYIWLPSLPECRIKEEGIWKTSLSQRKNFDGEHLYPDKSTSGTGFYVGGGVDEGIDERGSSQTPYTFSWLRSGGISNAYKAYYLDYGKDSFDSYYVASDSNGVRPALHLNLSSAALAAGLDSHIKSSWDECTEDYKSVENQGSGVKPDSPYLISTAEQLAQVAENVNNGIDCDAYFKLTQDIYLGGRRWTPIGNAEHPFTGTFEGDRNEIYGLKVRAKEANQGLFGCTGKGAEINGITINGGSITTSVEGYAGTLIGKMTASGTVTNCRAISIDVDGIDYVGGLIGYAEDGEFSNLISSCDVKGHDYVGGVFGYFNNGTFSKVSFSNIVTGNDNVGGIIGYLNKGNVGPINSACRVIGNDNVGGIIGYNNGATLIDISHRGEVEGRNYVGGVIGRGQGTMKNLFANGTIYGNQYIGGVIGYLNSGELSLSDSETTIEASSNIGGIAGYCAGTIKSCVSSCHIKGKTEYGGLVGYLYSGTLSDCAGFGSLYGGMDFVGCLVGRNNNRTVTACTYVGDSDNKNVQPFFGTGTGTYDYCYSIINQNKFLSSDTSDEGWLTYYGIVDELQTLPSQKELYWLVSVSDCTLEDIQKRFADFELKT